MSIPTIKKSVRLIIGVMYSDDKLFEKICRSLEKKFGKIDYCSLEIDFDFTRHYQEEMGGNLKRRFISFRKLIDPGSLAEIKLYSNKVEKACAINGNRRINIDPGYITDAKVVLATAKNYQHRIYLGRGIFAEVTLRYKDNTFGPWEWTYPDYRTKGYIDIFNRLREMLR